eukprot:3851630-Pleurochrysis_carterae.AAC.1
MDPPALQSHYNQQPTADSSPMPLQPSLSAPSRSAGGRNLSEGVDEEDCLLEELRGDEQETMPDLEVDIVVGNYSTALAAVTALLELHLELGAPWDNDSDETRRQKANSANEKGKAWAMAIRTHCGDSVGHYYMHVAFAHLKELLISHGHLQHGNDEVLEKGNRDVKRFRGMVYMGGSSAKDHEKQILTRYRKVIAADGSEHHEEYQVVRDNNIGPIEAVAKLQAAKELVEGKRRHEQSQLQDTSRVRHLAKAAKREHAADAKAASVRLLKQDATASAAAPD